MMLKRPWLKKAAIYLSIVVAVAVACFYQISNWKAQRALKELNDDLRKEGISSALSPGRGHARRSGNERLTEFQELPIAGLSGDISDWEISFDSHWRHDVRKWVVPQQPESSEQHVARELLVKIEGLNLVSAFKEQTAIILEETGGDGLTPRYYLDLHSFAKDLAILQMAAGDPDGAADSVETLLKIQNLPQSHSSWVKFLIHTTTVDAVSQLIREGIMRRAWTDAHLQRFQIQLDQFVLRKALDTAARGELAQAISNVNRWAENPRVSEGEQHDWKELSSRFSDALWLKDKTGLKDVSQETWKKIRPSGIKLSEMVADIRQMRFEFLDEQGALKRNFSWEELVRLRQPRPSSETDSRIHPILRGFIESALRGKTSQDVTRCAIALERYRLKHGSSPESLEALVPEFLREIPKDVCDGAPLRYARLPDGSPHVWSLWPSGKDEAGFPRKSANRGSHSWTTGKIPGLTEAIYEQ
jgi:hypothetical protein